MKIRYSVDDLKRSISGFASKQSMILVPLRHTPNPSSKFIDLDVEFRLPEGPSLNRSTKFDVLVRVHSFAVLRGK